MRDNYYLSLLKRRGLTFILIVTIFYILLVFYSDANRLLANLHSITLHSIFLILLSITASILIRSIRQLLLLKTIDINLSFGQNLTLYLAGLSMVVTPGSLGQMIKSHYLERNYNQNLLRTLPLALVERYYDVLAMLSFIVISMAVYNIVILLVPVLILTSLLAVITLVIKHHGLLHFFQRHLVLKIGFFKKHEMNSIEFQKTLSFLLTKKIMTCAFSLSMAAWFFEAIGIFLCFNALKIDLNFGLTTAFGFSSVLLGAISFIPVGAFVTEISFVQLLSRYGYEISTATALVLLMRLSTLWYSTVIGIIATRIIIKNR